MFGWKIGCAITFVAILCFFTSVTAWAKPGQQVEAGQSVLEQALREALQDEYQAQAEYEAILKKFDSIALFQEMKESERSHIVLLQGLIDKYNISYQGDFAVPAVTDPSTLHEAYQAAVSGEIDNIVLYEKLAERDGLPADVKALLHQLGEESRNHLIEFRRMLNSGQ